MRHRFLSVTACALFLSFLGGCGAGRTIEGIGDKKPDADQLAVEAATGALVFSLLQGDNASASAVLSNLDLISSMPDGVAVSWSSDSALIDASGTVNRPACLLDDAAVNLTATLSKGEASAAVTIQVSVPATSAAELVAMAAAWLDFDQIKGANTAASYITTALLLPNVHTACGQDVAIAWESTGVNAAAINTNDGSVVRPKTADDSVVTLVATLSRGTADSAVKSFVLTVIHDADYLAVGAAGEALAFSLIQGDNTSATAVLSNLELMSSMSDGVTVSWSSDSELINTSGVVDRPTCLLHDATVNLTATLSKGAASTEVTIQVSVPATSDAELVAMAAEWLDFDQIKGDNTAADNITTSLLLPDSHTVCEQDVTIEWESTGVHAASINTDDGSVVRSYQGEVEVDLEATLRLGEAEQAMPSFVLTIVVGDFTCAEWIARGSTNDDGDQNYFAYGDGVNEAEGTPFYICTAAHLNNLRQYLGAGVDDAHTNMHFKLMANIDILEYLGSDDVDEVPFTELGEPIDGKVGWQPIGPDFNDPFMGTFYGPTQEIDAEQRPVHVISNLQINRTSNCSGLFGFAWDAEIRGIGLEDVDVRSNHDKVGGLVGETMSTHLIANYSMGSVSGNGRVGGLVGEIYQSTVASNYATGSVSGAGNSIGGLVGFTFESTLSSNYATGSVSGDSDNVGGLVGQVDGDDLITSSYFIGSVSAGRYSAGGLVGYLRDSTISLSYSTNSVVSGGSWGTGGIVGYYDGGTIISSYSVGSVVSGGSNVGGLVGYADAGTIISSYATSSVSGGSDVGGLMGDAWAGGTSAIACYWNTDAADIDADGINHGGTGQTNSALAGAGAAEGKTTEQMKTQATYQPGTNDWDFSEVWGIDTDDGTLNQGFPYLLWQVVNP